MNVIDISWPITPDMTCYKNKRAITFTCVRFLEKEGVRETHIMLNSHSGTHINAPAHVFADGFTVDQVPLPQLIGTAYVLDMKHIKNTITADDLEQYTIKRGSIVLLKTSNSELTETAPFESNFISIDSSAAYFCTERSIKALGMDYLNLEPEQSGYTSNKILLQGKIALIEGLRLDHVEPGIYFFICLPLAIIGLEACPARAVLIEDM